MKSPEKLTVPQLKSALVAAWKKHSVLKKEMAPLLSALRRQLRNQGNRNPEVEDWGKWVEAGHIGICLRTANRWADDYEGKATSSKKSRSGLKARAKEAPVVSFIKAPRPSWMTDEKKKQLEQAIEIVGDHRALQLFFDAVTQAAAQQASRANEAMATHA